MSIPESTSTKTKDNGKCVSANENDPFASLVARSLELNSLKVSDKSKVKLMEKGLPPPRPPKGTKPVTVSSTKQRQKNSSGEQKDSNDTQNQNKPLCNFHVGSLKEDVRFETISITLWNNLCYSTSNPQAELTEMITH